MRSRSPGLQNDELGPGVVVRQDACRAPAPVRVVARALLAQAHSVSAADALECESCFDRLAGVGPRAHESRALEIAGAEHQAQRTKVDLARPRWARDSDLEPASARVDTRRHEARDARADAELRRDACKIVLWRGPLPHQGTARIDPSQLELVALAFEARRAQHRTRRDAAPGEDLPDARRAPAAGGVESSVDRFTAQREDLTARDTFARGVDAMDEAVRSAMISGAVRRGLSYAVALVNYLCELGEEGAADEVVERWVSGFGRIPETLGRLRIDVLAGRYDHVRGFLDEMQTEKEWRVWSRVLSVDATELAALTEIGESRFRAALHSLEVGKADAPHSESGSSRRAFLRAYALFESGDAEKATGGFTEARDAHYTIEFPYHSDPVLYVQAIFYLAECALAVGNEARAIEGYDAFLESWGEAAWELRAIERARKKLQSLDGDSSGREAPGEGDAG